MLVQFCSSKTQKFANMSSLPSKSKKKEKEKNILFWRKLDSCSISVFFPHSGMILHHLFNTLSAKLDMS